MKNPEQSPSEEIEPEESKLEEEKEQTPEEIQAALEFAVENKSEARLTVLSLDGKSSTTAIVSPEMLEKDVLWITTGEGVGMAIEHSRIKKVELPSGPEEKK